jgi:hypothetical protein
MTDQKRLNKIISDAEDIVNQLEAVKVKGVLKLHLALAVQIASYKTMQLVEQLKELKNENKSN